MHTLLAPPQLKSELGGKILVPSPAVRHRPWESYLGQSKGEATGSRIQDESHLGAPLPAELCKSHGGWSCTKQLLMS